MKINLELIILINYTFLIIIAGIFLTVFIRRLILFIYRRHQRPYLLFYQKKINQALQNPKKITPFWTEKRHFPKKILEETILNQIQTLPEAENETLTKIYEESGLAKWRITQLKSPNTWERETAADRLGRVRTRKAIIPLIISLRDQSQDVRFVAAKALGKLKATGAAEYLVSLLNDIPADRCPIIADILIDFGVSALPAINQGIRQAHPNTKYWTTLALAEIKIKPKIREEYYDLSQLLKSRLIDPSPKIRAISAVALARITSQRESLEISALLSDHSSLVRRHAAKALGIIKNPLSVYILIETLADKNWHVNQTAIKSLLNYGPRVTPKIKAHLQDPNPRIRQSCRLILELFDLNFYDLV